MQPTPVAPSVVLAQAGERKQVPLRDYLNARIAPFLKKAMTQSLEAEAEFPLQWLGECLINQSILYEGNPDATNIKERFLYNFDAPPPAPQEPAQDEMNGTEPTAVAEVVHTTAIATAPTSELPTSTEQAMTNGEPNAETRAEQQGNEEKEQPTGAPAQDTEMGGTT